MSVVNGGVAGRSWVREFGLAGACGLAAVTIATFVLRIVPAELGVLWAGGDALGVYSYAVNLSRGRWFLFNPDLGYPGFQDHGHWPLTDLVSLGQIGALAQVMPPIMAVNVFTLGTFFTVAAAGYLASRYAGVTAVVAFVTALSLSLVPWHFERSGGHLFLASYMSVPLALFLVTAVARGALDRPRPRLLVVALAAAVIIGANGVYYALMATILLATAVAFGSLRVRRFTASWRALLVIAAIPGTLAAILVVNMMSVSSKSTGDSVVRSADDPLVYAGDLTSLFRPDSRTVSGQFLSRVVNLGFPETPEGNAMYSSGVVLAVLITVMMVGLRWASSRQATSGTALRLATYWPGMFVLVAAFTARSGLGALFSRWITNDIRAWGRYTIFLAGIALLVAGLALTAWWRRPNRAPRLMAVLLTAAIGISAVVDISGGVFRRQTDPYEAQAQELRAYVDAVQARTEAGCPVLQLPLALFPEVLPPNGIGPYEELLPYLYSADLRYSYGAFKGTEFGDWGRDIAGDPTALLAAAQKAGFCGIEVDTRGWDSPDDAVAALNAFGLPDVVSSSGRWWYFDLTGPLAGEYTYAAGLGFSAALDDPAGSVWWLLADRGTVEIRGRANDRLVASLKWVAPPCGPVRIKLDGVAKSVSGTTTIKIPVKLDARGAAQVKVTAASESCAVLGSGDVAVGLLRTGPVPGVGAGSGS